MKYRFGNDNLITGYIKNLLHEFNLPQAKPLIDDMFLFDGKYYFKDRKLYYCTKGSRFQEDGSILPGTLKQVGVYNYGQRMENLTTNLVMNSSVYDSYTHAYLGEFLRFVRDYHKLDLMPLYNCFNNESPKSLKFTLDIPHVIESSEGNIEKTSYFRVDTSNDLYNYYIVPIKFNTKYNIAIESQVPYELCAMIYTGSQRLKISNQLMKQTYTLIGNSRFEQPFDFQVDVDGRKIPRCNYERYTDYEENLRLLIKIPRSVKSSIAIIEGDLLLAKSYGDKITSRLVYNEEEVIRVSNKEAYPDLYDKVVRQPQYNELKINTNLSLLSLNDGVSYPFADRLVEYLLRNVINHTEKLQYNISRVQDKVYPKFGNFKGFFDIWNIDLNYKIHDFINTPMRNSFAKINTPDSPEDSNDSYKEYSDDGYGVEKQLLVDYSKFSITDIYKDMLGYVDKDVEYHMEAL